MQESRLDCIERVMKLNAAIFVASGQGATAVMAPMSSRDRMVQSIGFVIGVCSMYFLLFV